MEQKKLKFLILGATGMAGHTISLYLNEMGHDVTTFSRKKFPYCKNINGDLLDRDFISSMIKEVTYDVIINCIGVLNQDCDENPDLAVYLNSYLPHFISNELKDSKTRLFHMSTDCVFSGKTGLYTENSLRDGESFYDRTKALGEINNKKDLTFRNSIIGPDMRKEGIGLFNWFMKQKGTINGYSKAIWTGVTTLTLAKAMEAAAYKDISGIYNLVNNEMISKYDLLELFNVQFKKGKLNIKENKTVIINKSLVNTRNDFSFKVPSYEHMIIEMKEWINDHKEFYTHYICNDEEELK